MNSDSSNLTMHSGTISHEKRETLLGQKVCIIWFTGLSGSGKSSIAQCLEERLVNNGYFAYVLDGDNLRLGINKDLGFSPEDRRENIRRAGEIAVLFADAGIIIITAFISPYKADRDNVRRIKGEVPFIEVFLDVPIEVCEKRDKKNLYKRACAGEISDFTGISAPYEKPENPEIRLDTSRKSISECADDIMNYLLEKKICELGIDKLRGTKYE